MSFCGLPSISREAGSQVPAENRNAYQKKALENARKAKDVNYRFLVSAFDHSYWVIGSVLGSLLGAILPFSTEGIEFSMTALFLTSFVEQWIKKDNRIPALTGLGATLLSLAVFGPERFLIPAMLLITLVLSLLRGRLGRGEAEA